MKRFISGAFVAVLSVAASSLALAEYTGPSSAPALKTIAEVF